MAQNVLNYEGLDYFLSKLAAYINNKTVIGSINTNITNGIGLSIDNNKQLSVNVTPGQVLANNTLFVTGGDVFNAIGTKTTIVHVNSEGIADKDSLEVYDLVMAGELVLAYFGKSYHLVANALPDTPAPRITYIGTKVKNYHFTNGQLDKISGPYFMVLVHKGTNVDGGPLYIADIDSPEFTGTPKAPTPAANNNSTLIATTEFVQDIANTKENISNKTVTLDASSTDTLYPSAKAVYDIVNSKHLMVTITSSGSSYSSDISFTEVKNALANKVPVFARYNYTQGLATGTLYYVGMDASEYYVKYVSFSNSYLATPPYAMYCNIEEFTHSRDNTLRLNTSRIAMLDSLSSYAPKNSPTLTGTPTAPTAELGTNTTLLATTAFVTNTVANAAIGKATFQGAIDSETDLSSLSNYTKGSHWLVLTAGTYVGQTCEVGDLVYCIADKNGEFKASDFTVILNNLDISIITNELIDALFE